MLFVHLLINCIILTLKMLNINLTQNVQITQSYYVQLTLGYVKNSTQNFNKILTQIQMFILYIIKRNY